MKRAFVLVVMVSVGVALLQVALPALAEAAKIRLVSRETSLGKMSLGMNAASLVVSPDGRRLAYGAERGGKWFVVVDGVEGPGYDGFLKGSKLIFDSPTSLHGLALRDNEFFRVQIDIVEGN